MASYILKNTPDGNKTLVYAGEKEIKLHSAYNPVREAERTAASFETGKANYIIVCGLALGYHISQLHKRFPDSKIIVIERDREVLEITGKVSPDLMESISVINNPSDLSNIFETIDMATFFGAAFYFHRPSYLIDKDFYDATVADINQYLSSKLSDLLTRFEFEERWIENILMNIHHAFKSTPVSALFGKFTGYPGIIVSAGPSLKKNISLLAKLRDRALIVAVDTSLKVLQRNNIDPHIVMTLDSQNYSMKHFVGLRNQSPVLCADVVSNPQIVASYQGPKMMSTTSKYYYDRQGVRQRETTPLMDWVEQYMEPLGDIQSGGSVATSAFDLLLNLGCSSIVLVGQDLAYTGREIHCNGTYHNDEWLTKISRFQNLDSINQAVIRKRQVKYIEAFGGEGTVISDFVFDLYRSWFADSAGKVSFPVINATEGGARIAHTKESTLADVLKSTEKKTKSPGEVLELSLSPGVGKKSLDRLIAGVKDSIAEIEEVCKELREEGIKNSSGDMAFIEELLQKKQTSQILRPLLRKTDTYLSRHSNINNEKIHSLLLSDITGASKRLLKFLSKCKDNLENVR